MTAKVNTDRNKQKTNRKKEGDIERRTENGTERSKRAERGNKEEDKEKQTDRLDDSIAIC
jgi:hypothetical protein